MARKHLKRLREEKSKVKLKKKLLPKGQNVTNTNFKSKQIQLYQKLKEPSEEHPSSYNLSLKELLSNLSHYNSNIRSNAVGGIKDMVKKHPEVLEGAQLRSMLSLLLDKVVDQDTSLRRATISLVSDIIAVLSCEQKMPYHDVLCVHLCCAMTHINILVQKDSLLLLDAILKHAPQVVREHSSVILGHVVRLLSNYKYGYQLEGLLKTGGKTDVKKIRLELLLKCYQIFCVMLKASDKAVEAVQLEVSYDSCKSYSLRHRTSMKNMCTLRSNATADDKVQLLRTYVDNIMPLVLDTWAEFCPRKKKEQIVSEAGESNLSGKVLEVALNLIGVMHETACWLGEEHWLVTKHSQSVSKCLFSSFLHNLQHCKGKVSIQLNLMLCYIYYIFNVHVKHQVRTAVESFLHGAMFKYAEDLSIRTITLKIIRLLLSRQHHGDASKVLTSVIDAYFNTTCKPLRDALLLILTDIADNTSLDYVHSNKDYQQWIAHLPHLLTSASIPSKLLQVLGNSVRKQWRPVIDALNELAPNILANLALIKVDGVESIQSKKAILQLMVSCEPHVLESNMSNIQTEYLRSYLQRILANCSRWADR